MVDFWLVPLALLDGLNVCALTLLALFISLMYISNASRTTVTALGSAYIGGVFISYLATGLGIMLLAVSLPTVPHFLSRVAISVMLFIGVANVTNYFKPGLLPTTIPTNLGQKAITMMKTASVPGIIFAGILAGLHNFPCACTGGIYMAFISLIADSPSRLLYLLAYNLVFVVPLAVILFVSSSKPVSLRIRRWHEQNKARTRLAIGLVMIAVGGFLLSFVINGWV